MSNTQDLGDDLITGTQEVQPAEVIIQEIPDEGGSLYNDPTPSDLNIFTDYQILARYERDGHIYMMGITSPNGFQGASVAFAQLASPTTLLIVDWTASQYFKQPPIPNIDTAHVKLVLLDEIHEPAAVVVGPDGTTPLYRISGTFVYGLEEPSKFSYEDITFPIVPWLDSSMDRTLPPDTITAGLILQPGF